LDLDLESESLSESESEDDDESAFFAGVGSDGFAFFAAGSVSELDESESESLSESESESDDSGALRLTPLSVESRSSGSFRARSARGEGTRAARGRGNEPTPDTGAGSRMGVDSASVVGRASEVRRSFHKRDHDGGGRKKKTERRAAAAFGTHLASMNTLAISVRSAVRFFACGLSESRETSVRDTPRVAVANRGSRRRRVVAIGAETARFFRCLLFRLPRRAPNREPRTHRLRGRHLLRLGLGLHRAQGILEPVRLEVRLDGRDEVGGVGTHRNCRWATASRRNEV
jgi:hypothetical protein